MAFLTEADRRAVAEAIRAAEARTSGEIVAVVAQRSSDYPWLSFAAPALVALLVPGLVAPFVGIVSSGDLFIVQLAVFLALYAVLMIPRIRMAVIPPGLKRAEAEQRAREQFFARGLHLTQDRTGVLIFVSVAERYVEVLADAGIDAKMAPSSWQSIVDDFRTQVRAGRVRDGFIAAVTRVGESLATHFPTTAKNPNELPDHLFVI